MVSRDLEPRSDLERKRLSGSEAQWPCIRISRPGNIVVAPAKVRVIAEDGALLRRVSAERPGHVEIGEWLALLAR